MHGLQDIQCDITFYGFDGYIQSTVTVESEYKQIVVLWCALSYTRWYYKEMIEYTQEMTGPTYRSETSENWHCTPIPT